MIAHVIRIEADWLRIPLLCFVWPGHLALYVCTAALPAAWGGHPHGYRLWCREFYALPVSLFWAAWDGDFVGMPMVRGEEPE